MSGFIYKVREFLQNMIPVAIIGALAFGGYNLYKQGTFRHGLKPAMHSIVKKIPYFGTKFGHYTSSKSHRRGSYVASSPRRSHVSKRHRSGSRKHKAVSRRANKKHRRHR